MVRFLIVAVSFPTFAFANFGATQLRGLVPKTQKLVQTVYAAPIRIEVRQLVERFSFDVQQLAQCSARVYPTPYMGNPPGPMGGPGAGYANPPGPVGGPGYGNPPGPVGGPGYGNPPGPVGGPGVGYLVVPPACQPILAKAKTDFIPVNQTLIGTAYELPTVYAALIEVRNTLQTLR